MKGIKTLNSYKPSLIVPREGDVSPWLNHMRAIFEEDDVLHLLGWFAHRVQCPNVKPNHALLIGGAPGVGKDTIIEPVSAAVGTANFASIRIRDLKSEFNPFVKSVLLRINELHDLAGSDIDKFELYESLKPYEAAPPSGLQVNEKHKPQYYVPNICGVIKTTNHKNALPLPRDDRRNYVAWSKIDEPSFGAAYFDKLYAYFENGGNEAIAHYLLNYDYAAAGFNPKATPPKTDAFYEMVTAGAEPEDGAMADALDKLATYNNDILPDAVTLAQIRHVADGELIRYLDDRRNARKVPYRLEKCGYVSVRNADARDGCWKIGGKRQAVYASKERSKEQRVAAAQALTDESKRSASTSTVGQPGAPPMPPR